MEQTPTQAPAQPPGREGRRRRVLVALDPCEAELADFDALARLAAGLNAELVGLVIEDLSVIEAADLPVTRLIPARCRELASVDAAAMRRAFRVATERVREGLFAAAGRWRLECSFEVTQSAGAARTVAGLAAADLLAFQGAGGAGRLRLSRVHGRLRAAGAPCPVMVVRRGDATRRPVVAVYEDEARVLDVARDLARVYDSPLLILAAADGEDRLRERARRALDWLHGAGIAGRVETWLAGGLGGAAVTVAVRLRDAYPGFVVIDERGALGGSIDPELLAEQARASLVVLGGGPPRTED